MYVWAFPEGDLTVGKLATQRVFWSAWKPVPNLGPETQRPNGSENALKADKTSGENDRQAPETNSTASTMSSVSARIRAEVPGRAARNVMGGHLRRYQQPGRPGRARSQQVRKNTKPRRIRATFLHATDVSGRVYMKEVTLANTSKQIRRSVATACEGKRQGLSRRASVLLSGTFPENACKTTMADRGEERRWRGDCGRRLQSTSAR